MKNNQHIRMWFTQIVAISIGLTTGCSATTKIYVKDAADGRPLGGVRVERHQPVSTVEKLINPVGSFYHPTKLSESKTTNSGGEVIFHRTGPDDRYRLYPKGTEKLLVVAFGKEAMLAPILGQTNLAGWGFSVWLERGTIKQSVWPIKE